MTEFINTLELELAQNANPKIALEQKAYIPTLLLPCFPVLLKYVLKKAWFDFPFRFR